MRLRLTRLQRHGGHWCHSKIALLHSSHGQIMCSRLTRCCWGHTSKLMTRLLVVVVRPTIGNGWWHHVSCALSWIMTSEKELAVRWGSLFTVPCTIVKWQWWIIDHFTMMKIMMIDHGDDHHIILCLISYFQCQPLPLVSRCQFPTLDGGCCV